MGAPETFTLARVSPLTPPLVFESCVIRYDADVLVYDQEACIRAIQEWASCGRRKAKTILWFQRTIAEAGGNA